LDEHSGFVGRKSQEGWCRTRAGRRWALRIELCALSLELLPVRGYDEGWIVAFGGIAA